MMCCRNVPFQMERENRKMATKKKAKTGKKAAKKKKK
jgi:hypothetical protein